MYKEGIGELGGIGWSMIPASIYITKNLSVSEKIIWGRINGLKNPFGYCNAKNRWLASQLDVKRETMSKMITDMVDKKYLSRVLVYRKGKDEILIDSLSGDNKDKVKGYKLADRRLVAREIHEDCYDDIEGLGGSAIPPSILCNKKIKHSHKMLWGRLYYLRQAKGYCWADNEWIAERSPYTRGSISNMISDMVAAGVLKRTMVYSNGEEELLENSWENNAEKTYPSGYDFVGRRLVTVEIEDIQNDSEHDVTSKTPDASLKNPAPASKNLAKELDLELDTSIRQKKEKKNGTKEKKENLKADCGYAAPLPTESKDSITNTGEEKYIRKVAEEVRNNGGDFSKYSAVPPWIFQAEELKVNQKILVGAIVSKCISTGNEWCSLRNRDLAKSIGLKQETISSLLSDLASKGFIKEEYIYIDGDGNTIKYKSWDSEQPLVLNGLYLVERRLSVTNRDDVDSIRESSRKSCGKIKYIDPEGNNKNRRNSNDADWAKSVHARDSYICQKCGCSNTTVNAHHIESYDVNEDLRTSIDNGATLCEECHHRFHSIYGNGNNTREQFAKFMEDDSKDKKEQECYEQ